MVALKLPVFAGMVPSIDKHLISEKNAQHSENTWLYSGALDGLPEDVEIHTLASPSAQAVFRIPARMEDPSYMFGSYWIEFQNPRTTFIPAPTAGDMYRRFYWASPSEYPKYNTFDRIKQGLPAWRLGLPNGPNVSVAVTGGSATTMVARAYIATAVSEYGEEGAAGAPFLVPSAKSDATFNVTVSGVDPSDLGVNRNVKKINIYRTIVSTQGTTTYYLVKTLDAKAVASTFSDTMLESNLASQPILESTMWSEPPALEGIITMPNGIIAGFVGNELWFSEPYRPHAWPAGYSLSLEYDIVGLGVINQTLVICTNGTPYTASGVSPSNMTTAKIASFEPCLSSGSIVSTEMGVFYASPNGLILVNPGVAENVTRNAISRDKWADLANGAKVRAGRVGTAYFAVGAGVSRAFQEENMFQSNIFQKSSTEGSNLGLTVDPTNENAGVSILNISRSIVNISNDAWSGELLSIYNGKVYWLSQEPGYAMRPYKWKSKRFQLPVAKNFAAFRCYFRDPKNLPVDHVPNRAVDQVFNPATQNLIVRIIADGRVIATREISKSGELHRLPTGFVAEFWEIEFEGKVRVNSFQMATSVKELSIA